MGALYCVFRFIEFDGTVKCNRGQQKNIEMNNWDNRMERLEKRLLHISNDKKSD